MGKIITVASQKGGVGKTTTALNFAYSLSRLGERVLLLDADPQGGMTIATNIRKKTDMGLFDLLAGSCKAKDIAFFTREKRLAIMGFGTSDPEAVMQMEVWAREGRLSKILQRFGEHFDYIIIDAPAGLGGLVAALLKTSQGVIIASQCKALSLKSLPKILSLVTWIRNNSNPALQLEGIILTMRDMDDNTENEMFAEVMSGFPEELFFSTTITHDPVFEAASIRSIPVAMMKAGHNAAKNYFALTTEFKEREMLAQAKGENDDLDSGLF
ncbi:MAG: ParA family protein [Candidatus Marinimicrobia bacterium]|nr:ParA family protein [Candidatus Neomarinimicrobiota bacterium]